MTTSENGQSLSGFPHTALTGRAITDNRDAHAKAVQKGQARAFHFTDFRMRRAIVMRCTSEGPS
jgi:hypothetical protein